MAGVMRSWEAHLILPGAVACQRYLIRSVESLGVMALRLTCPTPPSGLNLTRTWNSGPVVCLLGSRKQKEPWLAGPWLAASPTRVPFHGSTPPTLSKNGVELVLVRYGGGAVRKALRPAIRNVRACAGFSVAARLTFLCFFILVVASFLLGSRAAVVAFVLFNTSLLGTP